MPQQNLFIKIQVRAVTHCTHLLKVWTKPVFATKPSHSIELDDEVIFGHKVAADCSHHVLKLASTELWNQGRDLSKTVKKSSIIDRTVATVNMHEDSMCYPHIADRQHNVMM